MGIFSYRGCLCLGGCIWGELVDRYVHKAGHRICDNESNLSTLVEIKRWKRCQSHSRYVEPIRYHRKKLAMKQRVNGHVEKVCTRQHVAV